MKKKKKIHNLHPEFRNCFPFINSFTKNLITMIEFQDRERGRERERERERVSSFYVA